MNAGDFEQATSLINEGFAIVEREGDEEDPAFARLLCAAGALATYADEVDAGAALYRRAHDIVRPLGGAATVTLFSALRGLALTDRLRGWDQRAAERYGEARALLDHLDLPDAEQLRQEIDDELRLLAPGG